MDEQQRKKKERNKVLTGLGLTALIFAWFLTYLFSNMPSSGS